jgi:hypothetical protein
MLGIASARFKVHRRNSFSMTGMTGGRNGRGLIIPEHGTGWVKRGAFRPTRMLEREAQLSTGTVKAPTSLFTTGTPNECANKASGYRPITTATPSGQGCGSPGWMSGTNTADPPIAQASRQCFREFEDRSRLVRLGQKKEPAEAGSLVMRSLTPSPRTLRRVMRPTMFTLFETSLQARSLCQPLAEQRSGCLSIRAKTAWFRSNISRTADNLWHPSLLSRGPYPIFKS